MSLLRKQSPENRKTNIEYIQKTIKLQILGNDIAHKSDDEVTPALMKEFMELLIDLTNMNKSASNQVENATKRLLSEIDFKGIDFDDYLSQLSNK